MEDVDSAVRAESYPEFDKREEAKVTLRVPRGKASATVARILKELPVVDLTVQDPPIEEIIDQVFQGSDKLAASDDGRPTTDERPLV